MAYAFNHRGVVEFVREQDAAGKNAADRAERRLVGDVARGEQQRGFLAVQIRQFFLQEHMIVVRAADVAGAASTGTAFVQRLCHGGDDVGMLTHAEVVVGAPDRDIALACRARMTRARKIAARACNIHEHTVAAFGSQ